MITMAMTLTDVSNGETVASFWTWSAVDEFVVAVELTDPKKTVRWEFDRQIVIDGVHQMAGLWDVKIRPNGKTVRLTLSSPDGYIDLDCPRGPLRKFVDDIVPKLPEPRLPSDEEMAALVEQWARWQR